MNFCFDIDGPIIDVSDRYYRAYLESLKGYDINKDKVLSKEAFWILKQNRISELEIGLMVGLSLKEAKSSGDTRKDLNFKFENLYFDKLFDDVIKTFDYLKSNYISYFVVTLRSRKELNFAIKQFKLNKYLDEDYIFPFDEDTKVQNDIQGKYSLIYNGMNKLALNSLDTWVIGDSDTDIHAGRLARCGKVIGISRGMRSKEQLQILQPDYIVNNLSEVLSLANTVH
jgi:phosphoglycolate phosphatase-like HAD superfamily hydrolase